MVKVLLVDDDSDARETMAKLLELSGHTVVSVPNGREALGHVLVQVPDVVLLDLMMPEMDGPSFLEVVRLYIRLLSLPVVIYTGMADSPLVERARAANAILVKGKATPEEVVKAVEEAAIRLPT